VAAQKGTINKKKTNYLAGLKAVSNWVFGRQRKKEELEYIVGKYKLDNVIIKRFLLYTYGTPHLTWYINKYLNHLYKFDTFETTDLIYSLTYLLDINRISKKSIPDKLFYLKNTELADKNKQKIKKLIKEYFSKLHDKEYHDTELNIFYDLVLLNFISTDDLEKMDKHINGGNTTLKLEESDLIPIQSQTNNFVLDIYREFPKGIKEFIDSVKQFILAREQCKKCELFGKPTVVLDTNMEDAGEVDIMFFGLNPGTDEVDVGKTFVGKAGKTLRERVSKLPANIKWVITNIIMCHTRNEKEIKDIEDVKNRCQEIVEGIKVAFPAKILVPLGAKAASVFGLTGGMSNLSGKIFTSPTGQTIIPITHPSAVNYNPSNLDKFKKDFDSVLNLFKTEAKSTTISLPKNKPVIETTSISPSISSNKFITEITPDLTFFDVREVDNNILLIYIDSNGQKKYKLETFDMHFYIKNDTWKNCHPVTDKIDGIVRINGREKYQAIKFIRDKLNDIKRGDTV
jgi:uracil-DNA glycosylase family 4